MSDTDASWFKRNGDANFRIRRPAEGEVAEIARRFGSGAAYDLAVSGGVLPPPTVNVEWWIMVIKIDRDTQVRMLTLRDVGTDEEAPAEFSVYAVATRQRVAIDRR